MNVKTIVPSDFEFTKDGKVKVDLKAIGDRLKPLNIDSTTEHDAAARTVHQIRISI